MATVLTERSLEDEIRQLLAEDRLYEVIDGQVVEIDRMGASETKLASWLIRLLGHFVDPNDLGHVVMETLFDLSSSAGHKRRPDLAFVSADRWPVDQAVPEGDAWCVVPDLAVEVVSPTNSANEIMERMSDFFIAGVRCVWVIYPRHREVQVYTSLHEMRGYGLDDRVPGDPVLPGLQLPLTKLFRTAVSAEPERSPDDSIADE